MPPKAAAVRADNGIRGDSTPDALAKLRPAFDRRFGTITAGNSSYLTDGGAAVLLASEDNYIISKNVSYEDSDAHQYSGKYPYQRFYPRRGEQ